MSTTRKLVLFTIMLLTAGATNSIAYTNSVQTGLGLTIMYVLGGATSIVGWALLRGNGQQQVVVGTLVEPPTKPAPQAQQEQPSL